MAWSQLKTAIASTTEDDYQQFADHGAEAFKRFKSASHEVRVSMYVHATVYQLGTYDTDETQVADAWSETVDHFESADMDNYVSFLAQTNHSSTKIDWLKTSIENGVFRETVEIMRESGLDAAMDHLINYRHSAGDTGAKGFMTPKVGMAALLLGHPDAFVVDRNVAQVLARYLQKRYAASENLDNLDIEVPKCSACWNTYLEGRLADEKHERVFSSVKEYGYGIAKHPFKDHKWAYFHDLEYFRDHHFKGEHIKNYQELEAYGEILKNKVSDLVGAELDTRTVTQIAFNVGMAEGGKAEEKTDVTYTHEAFYATL